jgi:iron complex outermembrane recepter protein
VAIDGITVMSNNPVFGLNAIGGPVSIAMKDGLASIVETDTRFGYYGRAMGSLQVGEKSGPFAAYLDDGYRDQGRGQDQLSQRKVVGLRGFNYVDATFQSSLTMSSPNNFLGS